MKHVFHAHTHAKKIFIDEIAYDSKLRNTSPYLKLLISLYGLLLCLIAQSYWISGLILVCMLLGMACLGKTKWHDILHLMQIPLAFLILGCVMLLIKITQTPDHMLLRVDLGSWTVGISRESLSHFSHLFLRCLAAISCMYFLSTSTPMTELFTALRRLHLPVFLVEMMELVYRYIFVLLEIASQMRHAQECRLGYANIRTGSYSMGQLISNLFIRAYRQAERTYMAMESRGYTGEIRTLGYVYHTKHWQIWISVGYIAVLSVATAVCKIWGIGG